MQVSRYEAPESLDAAVALLANDNEARVIAGGTDLLVQMRTGGGAPSAFIDIKRIPEMSRLEIDSSGPQAWITLAQVFEAQGQPREAQASKQQARGRWKDDCDDDASSARGSSIEER